MADRNSIGDSVLSLIGNTPMVYLRNVSKGCKGRVAVKLEYFNPACSVKDRIGYSMIMEAEKAGRIRPGVSTLIETTSGNTGIALASMAAANGYRCVIVMPSSMSLERRTLLCAFGAELVLTDPAEGIVGAFKRADELAAAIPDSFLTRQFENEANPKVHYETTGPEIWRQTDGKVDAVVFGVGTGGTLTGVGRFLREKKPEVRIFGVEPAESAILNGEEHHPHKIQGIGAGMVPPLLENKIYEAVLKVPSDDAIEMSRRMAKEEGILCGISSGANVQAAIRVANMDGMEGKLVVTSLASFGERYLSTALYDSVREQAAAMQVESLEANLARLNLAN